MEISQLAIARLCFYAFLLGIGLGLFYDVLRVSRIYLGAHCSPAAAARLHQIRLPLISPYHPHRKRRLLKLVFFFEDLLFCLLSGVALILLFYQCNNGRVRLPALPFAVVGFYLYRVTLGRLLLSFAEGIAFLLSCAVRYVFFFAALPFRWIAKMGKRVICRAWRAIRVRRLKKQRIRYSQRLLQKDPGEQMILHYRKLKEKERQNAEGKKKTV